MREFLVTKFVCSICGDNLQLTPTVPKNAGKHAVGEPTGAEMISQVIALEPCRCLTERIDRMRQAAKVLFEDPAI